ncbi:MAG: hypothetical protein RLO81_09540 [Fulvivirga sp.]|uniref:hypothetical protein n=1 Tax=Fulvivirga sp. TaxID=1931237 RepID=UPI0032EE24F7
MTNKETVNRNIGLTFDFLKQALKQPELIDQIKDGSTIEFIQKDYPEIEKKSDVVPDKFIKVKRGFELI